jgi:hypothetical protein
LEEAGEAVFMHEIENGAVEEDEEEED